MSHCDSSAALRCMSNTEACYRCGSQGYTLADVPDIQQRVQA